MDFTVSFEIIFSDLRNTTHLMIALYKKQMNHLTENESHVLFIIK